LSVLEPISVSVREWNAEKTYKDDEMGLLFEWEWNIEKTRGIDSGMVRKERGIERKKTETPSGILRKMSGVLRRRGRSDKAQDVKYLGTLCFSAFHSHVHLMVFQLIFQYGI
jgi:hypothetical protein